MGPWIPLFWTFGYVMSWNGIRISWYFETVGNIWCFCRVNTCRSLVVPLKVESKLKILFINFSETQMGNLTKTNLLSLIHVHDWESSKLWIGFEPKISVFKAVKNHNVALSGNPQDKSADVFTTFFLNFCSLKYLVMRWIFRKHFAYYFAIQ